jgi:hypothetical protein
VTFFTDEQTMMPRIKQIIRYGRLLVAAVLLLTAVTAFSMPAGTNGSALQKECKKVFKQLKQEGWTVLDGSSADLKTALSDYYGTLENGGTEVQPLMATGSASNVNQAKIKATARASKEYATLLRSEVKNIVQVNAENSNEEGEKTTKVNIERTLTLKVEQMVKAMKPVLTLRREVDGNTEVQMFFVLKHISLENADE